MRTYRRRKQLMQEQDFSVKFLDTATAGLRKYPERYPNAIIQSGRIVLIDTEMLWDWIKFRDALEAQAPVPPFRREEYQ